MGPTSKGNRKSQQGNAYDEAEDRLIKETTHSSTISEETLHGVKDQEEEDETSYFTTVDIHQEPDSATTIDSDVGNNRNSYQQPYASHSPSPLRAAVDNEKWSDQYHHHYDSTVIPDDPIIQQHHKQIKKEVQLPKEDLEHDDDDSSSVGDIDDDKDHDFDWNDNPEDRGNAAGNGSSILKRNRTVQRLQKAYTKYCCWHYLSQFMKRVIIAVIGSTIFIVVGVCFYIYFPRPSQADLQDPNFTNVRANVQVWMYWAAFMWHMGWITTFMLEAVPYIVHKWVKIFRGRRSEKVKSYMEYYMSLKSFLAFTVITAWNWGTWAFLINIPFSSVLQQSYTMIIWKVFGCLFVASVYLLLQKTIIQVIATRFHRFAFKDRVKENRRAIKILDTLGKSEYKRGFRSSAAAAARLRNRKSRPEFNTSLSTGGLTTSANANNTGFAPSTFAGSSSTYAATTSDFHITNNRDSYSRQTSAADLLYSFKKNVKKAVINDHPHESRQLKEDMDINSDEYAKKNARKLYISLAYPDGILPAEGEARRCLLLSDFEPYFKTAEEAKKAFEIFDRDGNGDITRREFRDTVVHVYRERKDISISIRDTSQALGKVDYMLLGVSIIALLFTSFAIFNVEVWKSLVPLGSILLALSFVFGNTAKNTFESILFLFVSHVYDTGDYVLVDDQYLLVHNVGVMGTTFISGDGQTVFAPTTVLMTKLITNVRRSGNMGESVKINIDFRTTSDQFWELHDRLSAWVASQSRDFGPGFDVRVADIIDVNQLILNIWLPHKGNWQELGKRFKRKTRFMLALKDILTELNIKYELPAQRITQSIHHENQQPIFGALPSEQAIKLESTPQTFSTASSATSSVVGPTDPTEIKALSDIKRERNRHERYNVDNTGSTSASGDGGW